MIDELKNDIKAKMEQATKRAKERAITLREFLIAMAPEEPLPDEWGKWDDVLSQSVFRLNLCFMSEEETWIKAYRDHPILIPWYDCKIVGFNPSDDKSTIDVWMWYEDYIPKLIENHRRAAGD